MRAPLIRPATAGDYAWREPPFPAEKGTNAVRALARENELRIRSSLGRSSTPCQPHSKSAPPRVRALPVLI